MPIIASLFFNAKDISESKLGKVAHNNNILSSIFDLLRKLPNIDILEKESVLSINNGTESIEIKTDSGLDLMATGTLLFSIIETKVLHMEGSW